MLKTLTRAESAGILFLILLVLIYAVGSLVLHFYMDSIYALQFAGITVVGALAFFLGWQVKIRARMPLLQLDVDQFILLLWVPFLIFAVVAWSTAEQIPLVAALGGADSETISILREQFFKARPGWQASFVYIHAILTGALIPYSIAKAFFDHHRLRWALFLFFLFYCITFMEKAYFLKAMFPLIYLVFQGRIRLRIKPIQLLAITFSILLLVTYFSGSRGEVMKPEDSDVFFSMNYAAAGPLQHLLWRSVAIPIITAVDSLRTFYETFGGEYFRGATTSVFSWLFGLKNIQFERAVFFAQGGQNATETGSANAVYLVEAFINWGYTGVVIISFIAGALLRFMVISDDEPLKALWILFAMGLFVAGLVGILFSNGFLLLFLMAFFVKIGKPKPVHQVR
ncbi:MAG: hypothetical protein HXX12_11840 [Geothrix sp.]|uniref:hypothetical protein n=1 Tax=Geothrix sp. TaxID=1962974 RepID=UPI00181D9F19|nr:hypothetical protein [Geothrix sp.]NWJ41646.1 hypothetical protein [Geothrix sp.]WIL20371.1 MAG: hypothetical protein QOZ81_002936 [Geothrix sp.]